LRDRQPHYTDRYLRCSRDIPVYCGGKVAVPVDCSSFHDRSTDPRAELDDMLDEYYTGPAGREARSPRQVLST
jgi:hypothetical protein